MLHLVALIRCALSADGLARSVFRVWEPTNCQRPLLVQSKLFRWCVYSWLRKETKDKTFFTEQTGEQQSSSEKCWTARFTFGGRGGGTPGLSVDLKSIFGRNKMFTTEIVLLCMNTNISIYVRNLQLNFFSGIFQMGDVSTVDDRCNHQCEMGNCRLWWNINWADVSLQTKHQQKEKLV